MKIATVRKQLSHDRIVDVASRAIRRAGFQGAGVADIMKDAGLTHGGFYAHFSSKDALLAESLERAGRDSQKKISERMEQYRSRGATPLGALVEAYLSLGHAQDTELGCPIAALLSEIPRQSPEARSAFQLRLEGFINKVQQSLPAPARRDTAEFVASTLIGAVQIARALGTDSAESMNLLNHTKQTLLQQFDHLHDDNIG